MGQQNKPFPEFDEQVLQRLAAYESEGRPLSEALARDYLVDSSVLMDSLRAALIRGDWDTARDAAYALRGTSLTLGLVRVAELCTTVVEKPFDVNIAELYDFWSRACRWLEKFLSAARSPAA